MVVIFWFRTLWRIISSLLSRGVITQINLKIWVIGCHFQFWRIKVLVIISFRYFEYVYLFWFWFVLVQNLIIVVFFAFLAIYEILKVWQLIQRHGARYVEILIAWLEIIITSSKSNTWWSFADLIFNLIWCDLSIAQFFSFHRNLYIYAAITFFQTSLGPHIADLVIIHFFWDLIFWSHITPYYAILWIWRCFCCLHLILSFKIELIWQN